MKYLIIIPLYNKQDSIDRCLKSVCSQTIGHFKILVVNDGSTDASVDVVNNIRDVRITVIDQANAGVSAARNLGLRYAIDHDYDHIFLLDADDYWLPDHMETHIKLSQQFPDTTAFSTNYTRVHTDHLETSKFSLLNSKNDQVLDSFFEHNYLNSIFLCSNVSFKTSILEKTGLFDTQCSHAEDTDFFIRVGMHARVSFSHKVTVMIDVSAENRSDVIAIRHRNYPDFSVYNEFCDQHSGLQKYLDLNYYAIALLYRLENEVNKAKEYEKCINFNNLSLKQRQLLKISGNALKYLKEVQHFLQRKGMRLRSGY